HRPHLPPHPGTARHAVVLGNQGAGREHAEPGLCRELRSGDEGTQGALGQPRQVLATRRTKKMTPGCGDLQRAPSGSTETNPPTLLNAKIVSARSASPETARPANVFAGPAASLWPGGQPHRSWSPPADIL